MARTNIELDDRLVEAGFKITKCKTKKDLVNFALKELVAKKSRKELLELEGKVVWEGRLSELRKTRI
ncbi:MAG TPA: type II toxin-antitoxin system VapB family antitoxin [Nitrospiria bacterium]|nr:type II toxin-antitoxin system VapB family antitoxin [Candidatus Manganitrophaceae bacterium]HIL33819.1 type II toxin-antitoxin system VapB family antitoxin [Candidatus Manganitrophaceae bacterium]